jgi:Nucleotidyl transferase AbiEii toxin, Type IV TA system
MLNPRLDILPAPQQKLWSELSSTPKQFVLYGGTALALRLGHRFSVDFDFFGTHRFVASELRASLPYLVGGQTIQEAPSTLTMILDREGPVQVSFFGVPLLGQIEPHEIAEGPAIRVASLIDLSGMKAAVVYRRAEPKDYFDIHALLVDAKISLPTMLSAAKIIYGEDFNPLIALKAISYHDDAALASLPESLRRDLVAAVRDVDLNALPELNAISPRKTAK